LAQRGFLLNVSHELRTFLQAITGFNELILGQDSPSGKGIMPSLFKTASKSLLALLKIFSKED
jgi:signal transduction histidine kinase